MVNKMKLAFVYAGQGSQAVGMGQELYETYPVAKQVFDSIDLDFDVKKLCFEGPMEQLSQTQYTQPCMVATAIAITEVLKDARNCSSNGSRFKLRRMFCSLCSRSI